MMKRRETALPRAGAMRTILQGLEPYQQLSVSPNCSVPSTTINTIADHVAKMATHTRRDPGTIHITVWFDIISSEEWHPLDVYEWVAHTQQEAFQRYLIQLRRLASGIDQEQSNGWYMDDCGTYCRFQRSLYLTFTPKQQMLADMVVDRWGTNTTLYHHRHAIPVHAKETPY